MLSNNWYGYTISLDDKKTNAFYTGTASLLVLVGGATALSGVGVPVAAVVGITGGLLGLSYAYYQGWGNGTGITITLPYVSSLPLVITNNTIDPCSSPSE